MACHSLIVTVAVLAGDTRVVAVTIVIASLGKGVHFVIAFFVAAVVHVERTKLVKGVNSYLFCLFLSTFLLSLLNAAVTLAFTNAFKSL